MNRFHRVAVYPVEQFLALLPDRSAEKHTSWEWEEIRQAIWTTCGYHVKMGSIRYQLFKQKGTTCVGCGLSASFAALEIQRLEFEKYPLDLNHNYHFNLYSVDSKGREVLLTADHIIPSSRGGANKVENLQVMCSNCNTHKSDRISTDFHPIYCCSVLQSKFKYTLKHGWQDPSNVIFIADDGKLCLSNKDGSSFINIFYCPWCGEKIRFENPLKNLTVETESDNVGEIQMEVV